MLDRKRVSGRSRRRQARLLRSAYFFVCSVLLTSLAAAIGGAVYLVGRLVG